VLKLTHSKTIADLMSEEVDTHALTAVIEISADRSDSSSAVWDLCAKFCDVQRDLERRLLNVLQDSDPEEDRESLRKLLEEDLSSRGNTVARLTGQIEMLERDLAAKQKECDELRATLNSELDA